MHRSFRTTDLESSIGWEDLGQELEQEEVPCGLSDQGPQSWVVGRGPFQVLPLLLA